MKFAFNNIVFRNCMIDRKLYGKLLRIERQKKKTIIESRAPATGPNPIHMKNMTYPSPIPSAPKILLYYLPLSITNSLAHQFPSLQLINH